MTTTTDSSDGILRSPFITKLTNGDLYAYKVRMPDGAQRYCVNAAQVLAAVFDEELPARPTDLPTLQAECEAAAYKDSRAFGQTADWAAKVARNAGLAFAEGYHAKPADMAPPPHLSTTYEQEAYRDGTMAKAHLEREAARATD